MCAHLLFTEEKGECPKRKYSGGLVQGEKTGQLADKPTRGQSSRGLVNLRNSQLAEMFDL